jgi:N-acetyltransferase
MMERLLETRGPMNVPVVPPVLAGVHVRLEPLTPAHSPALTDAGLDPELWRWTVSQVTSPADMRDYVDMALQEQAAGRSLPFATVHAATGRVAGSTRLGSIDRLHRRAEIGWTWLGRDWQRTALNTEAKLLMLRYAFEVLGCIRVELKTDALNTRSRAAILRLGAREEGILRRHMITAAGRVRDTVYFSILADEWPGVETRLVDLLNRPSAASP